MCQASSCAVTVALTSAQPSPNNSAITRPSGSTQTGSVRVCRIPSQSTPSYGSTWDCAAAVTAMLTPCHEHVVGQMPLLYGRVVPPAPRGNADRRGIGYTVGEHVLPEEPDHDRDLAALFHVQLDRIVFTRRIWFRRGSGAGSLLVAVVVVLAGEPVLGGLVGDVAEAVAGG